jgi:hypothetical protein
MASGSHLGEVSMARVRWIAVVAGLAVAVCAAVTRGEPPADEFRDYAVAEAVFLQRGNTAIDQPLAVENDFGPAPGTTLLSAGDMGYGVAPGVRLFAGRRREDCRGWEIGYLGVYGMRADAGVTGNGTLRLPGGLGQILGSGFDAADAVAATTNSSLCSAEFNVFDFWSDGGRDRSSPYPWRRSHDGRTTHDWLLGVRWAWLDETATLDVTAVAGEPASAYRVRTDTNWIGPQIGYRTRTEWQAWAFEGWAKTALAGTVVSQSQDALVGPFDGVEVRGPTRAASGGVGMIGDLNFTLVRHFGDVWAVRAGYNLLWLTNAAVAANQWDFSDTAASGTGLVDSSTVFLHGASVGLEARW